MDFKYSAKARDGSTRNGSYSARSEADVVSWIRGQGLIPITITQALELPGMKAPVSENAVGKRAGGDGISFFTLAPKVKTKDKLIFFRQLATMITAGIPVTASLAVLIDQTSNKRFKAILKKVYDRVSAGTTLGNAMSEFPRTFDKVAIPLVKSGEESGTLDESLQKLAQFIEANDALKKKIVSALTYPAVVVSIALMVLGILVAYVIPLFEKSFRGLNIEMPRLTMMIFNLGRWLQAHWYWIPISILLLVFIAIRLRALPAAKKPIDKMMIKIPIFGDIIYKASLTRSFRTMGSLLKSGVPVLQSLEMTSDVAGNEQVREAFLKMRDGAAMGTALNMIVRENKLFPPMIGHMIAVGEETGRTDEMLEKVADWYDTELTEKVKRLSSLLEPVMVVFVGIIVGFMVVAIFLPIVTAINTLSQ